MGKAGGGGGGRSRQKEGRHTSHSSTWLGLFWAVLLVWVTIGDKHANEGITNTQRQRKRPPPVQHHDTNNRLIAKGEQ